MFCTVNDQVFAVVALLCLLAEDASSGFVRAGNVAVTPRRPQVVHVSRVTNEWITGDNLPL